MIAGGQAQRVVDAIPQEQLDALPLGRLDFIGMNIYNSVMVRAGANGKPEFCPRAAGHPRTAIGWPITPESMEWGTRFIWEQYGLPIYITENGLSCTDSIHLDGKVHDPRALTSPTAIFWRCAARSTVAWMCAAISTGHCWIILSGARAITSALA